MNSLSYFLFLILKVLLLLPNVGGSNARTVGSFNELESAIQAKARFIIVNSSFAFSHQIILPSVITTTIKGSSAAITLRGPTTNRFFFLNSSTASLTLENIKLRGSSKQGVISQGGLIYAKYGTVVLNTTIASLGVASYGSAIFIQNGTLVLKAVSFSDNVALSTTALSKPEKQSTQTAAASAPPCEAMMIITELK